MEGFHSAEGIKTFIKIIFICIFIFCAVIGNGSVIHVIRKFPKLQTTPNYFVFNLAVADLLFALTGMVMILITSVAGDWILGDVMCDVGGFLNSVFCSTSIWTLVLISSHRYFAVTKPVRAKFLYTRKRTSRLIFGIWVFAFAISSPPLFGWSRFAPGSNFCTVDGRDDMAYSIFLLLTDYVFPFLFLTGIYLRIFFVLKKHENAMKHHRNTSHHTDLKVESEIGETDVDIEIEAANTVEVVNGIFKNLENDDKMKQAENNGIDIEKQDENNTNNFETEIIRPVVTSPSKISLFRASTKRLRRNQITNKTATKKSIKRTSTRKKFFKEVKVTKMLLIVVCGFFLCWTPFLVAGVLYAFMTIPSDMKLLTIGIMFACLNSIINPIIYAVMNQSFRASFKMIARSFAEYFCCQRTKVVSVKPEK